MYPIDSSNENWMKNLPDHVIDKPFTSLIFPGTHDSGAYRMDVCHPIPTADAKFLKLTPLLAVCPCIENFVGSWTLTQSNDLYSQLQMGIRCFDLRLALDEDDHLWIVHMFTLVLLRSALNAVNLFLNEHPSEFIIIRCKPGWEQRNTLANQEAVNKVKREFTSLFGNKILEFQNFNVPTLRYCRNAGKQIVIVFEADGYVQDIESALWPSSYVISNWSNVNNVNALIDALTYIVQNQLSRVDYKLQELSFVLTPQSSDIKTALFRMFTCRSRESLETFADEVRPKMNQLILSNQQNLKNFGIITMDYPDPVTVQYIIDLN
jgi:hypothetical protein